MVHNCDILGNVDLNATKKGARSKKRVHFRLRVLQPLAFIIRYEKWADARYIPRKIPAFAKNRILTVLAVGELNLITPH
jgi:hypothetical protein